MESQNTNRYLIPIGVVLCTLWLTLIFEYSISVGWIGEVTPMWGSIPTTNIDQPLSCVGSICLYPTRPLVRWGEFPWMLNVYTASFPDWPQWILYRLFHSPLVIRASQVLSTLLLIVGMGYWTRKTLTPLYFITFFALLLTDWNFLFYKKALGNTEIMLQLAWMSCVLSLMPPKSSLKPIHIQHQKWFVFIGIILGTWAKLPFILHIIPLMLFIWGTHNRRIELSKTVCISTGIALLPCILLIGWTLNIDIPVRSHDFWTLQWERISAALQGNSSNARENSHNLGIWLGDPLQFFQNAYGVTNIAWHGWGRVLGYIVFGGTLFRLRNRTLWYLIGTLCIQVLILSWVAQDLHHIVIATPLLWYTIVRISQEVQPHKMLFALMTAGILSSNIWMLWDAPTIIESIETPTFSESKQQQLVDLLNTHDVSDVITMDYEIFGVLEVHSPSLNVLHMWPKISVERWEVLPSILEQHVGSHLLVLSSSMPMIYNLQPTHRTLKNVGSTVGIKVEKVNVIEGIDEVDSLKGVSLYRIVEIPLPITLPRPIPQLQPLSIP